MRVRPTIFFSGLGSLAAEKYVRFLNGVILKKTLLLNLKNFPTIPNSLRPTPTSSIASADVEIDIARLFHHYYIDKHGKRPPEPDLAQFEPARFITNDNRFRFIGDGFGDYPAAKQAGSNQLGQAFFRWFLHDHCGITYFAHMHKFLNRNLQRGFGNLKLNRVSDGDVPDYICAKNTSQVCIGEAKGRYSSIGFHTKEFQKWRDQFNRIAVVGQNGIPITIKGYIVGTRFATEIHPKVQSAIYVEDPETRGERSLSDNERAEMSARIIRLHYARIVEKMNMPLLAAALESGAQMPDELQPRAAVWEFLLDVEKVPKRYVGGYWQKDAGPPPIQIEDGKIVQRFIDPFRLNADGATFVGIEESIFKQIASVGRRGNVEYLDITQFPDPGPFYSSISTLRDGSMIAPIDFFRPVDMLEY